MKRKAPLTLMEQLVMVLVFALAAALCVSCFAAADRLSRRNAVRDDAVIAVRNAAETVKSCRGDFEQAAAMLDGTSDGTGLEFCPGEDFSVVVTAEDSGTPLLGKVKVEARAPGDGEVLFTLTVLWQEVDGHG